MTTAKDFARGVRKAARLKDYTAHPRDDVGDVMRYEAGEMDEDEMQAFFQRLVDTGLAWKLQGSYGRMANTLISAGLVEA